MSRRVPHHSQPAQKPLSADRLVRDFGSRAPVTQESVAALYAALVDRAPPETTAALERWRTFSRNVYGQAIDRPSAGMCSLATSYKVPLGDLRPAELLLATQTHYVLLVKLLVWEIVAAARQAPSPAKRIAQAHGDQQLRAELERCTSGELPLDVNVSAMVREEPFSWCLAALDEPIASSIRRLAAEVSRYDCEAFLQGPCAGEDLLKGLFERLFPKRFRHALGQYYTPDWLAEHVLDEVGYSGQAGARLLDPACGSGTFLIAAIRRIRRQHGRSGSNDPRANGDLLRTIRSSVVGFDLDPLAVMAARANYLIAVCDLLPRAGAVSIPVYFRDSILGSPGDDADGTPGFDYVVGNPPWIAWDHLSEDYREATKPLWQRYGLFSLSGTAARHGGGKKDLSMLMLYVAADRHLKGRGRLGMVITQTLFQTKGAGDGFRRFRLGDDGAWLRVVRVNDMVALQPFPGAANWTSTIILEKGSPTIYPVPYVKWSWAEGAARVPLLARCRGTQFLPVTPDAGSERAVPRRRFLRQTCEAEPIDPAKPTSPWLVRPPGQRAALQRLIGPSDYEAHLGANSGGANGVFWLELLAQAPGGLLVRNMAGLGKRSVETIEQVIEADLLYPLLRWADVTRYRAAASAHVLLAQDPHTRRGIDEATLRQRHPKTYGYLRRFQAILSSRAAYRKYQQDAPFWSMYDVGPYTVAPYKVVWRRMDRQLNAAVAEPISDPQIGLRPVIPQETCVLVAAGSLDEAHYLCALLNSSVVGFLVRAHSVRGGKGFGTPSILEFLGLRRFRPDDPRHAELAACSRQAHRCVEHGEDCAGPQARIDHLAATLRGLEPGDKADTFNEQGLVPDFHPKGGTASEGTFAPLTHGAEAGLAPPPKLDSTLPDSL